MLSSYCYGKYSKHCYAEVSVKANGKFIKRQFRGISDLILNMGLILFVCLFVLIKQSLVLTSYSGCLP